MKKIYIVLIITFICTQVLKSQSAGIQGKPIAEIFTDFHYIFNDTTKKNGFDLNRAHLGYSFLPGGNFTSTIIINIGSPLDLAEGSSPKRYAFFREASIAYSTEKLTVNFGIVNTRIFDYQQAFWGKRYLGPEFQAAYGYGSVADLGVVIDYRFNENIKADLSILNGEGYMNIQMDNSLKTALGVTITTPNKIAIRLYGDIMKPDGVLQCTMIGFAGFKTLHTSFGAEASYKTNIDLTEGHDAWGLSATGSYIFDEKSEIFTRYDYTASVIVPGEEFQWASKKDGTYLIIGYQRTFTKNFKMAINYRNINPYSSGKHNTDAIYLNAAFKF